MAGDVRIMVLAGTADRAWFSWPVPSDLLQNHLIAKYIIRITYTDMPTVPPERHHRQGSTQRSFSRPTLALHLHVGGSGRSSTPSLVHSVTFLPEVSQILY